MNDEQREALEALGGKLGGGYIGYGRAWEFPADRIHDRYACLHEDGLTGDAGGVLYHFETFADAVCWLVTGYYDPDYCSTVDSGDPEVIATKAGA